MCDWVENALVLEVENERGLFGWLTLEGVSVGVGRQRPEPEGAEPTDPGEPEAVDAGSDLFLTNSFGGNASRLKLHNAQNRARELSRIAALNIPLAS